MSIPLEITEVHFDRLHIVRLSVWLLKTELLMYARCVCIFALFVWFMLLFLSSVCFLALLRGCWNDTWRCNRVKLAPPNRRSKRKKKHQHEKEMLLLSDHHHHHHHSAELSTIHRNRVKWENWVHRQYLNYWLDVFVLIVSVLLCFFFIIFFIFFLCCLNFTVYFIQLDLCNFEWNGYKSQNIGNMSNKFNGFTMDEIHKINSKSECGNYTYKKLFLLFFILFLNLCC